MKDSIDQVNKCITLDDVKNEDFNTPLSPFAKDSELTPLNIPTMRSSPSDMGS